MHKLLMKRLIIILPIILLFIQCEIVNKKTAQLNSFSVINDMYGYELKFTKLPGGTIPEASFKVPIGDTVKLSFEWVQKFETKPFVEQPDPFSYGSSSDTSSYFFLDSDVEYTDLGAGIFNARLADKIIVLGDGEYQVQIRAAIWSVNENKAIWSKYSNAISMFAFIQGDPPQPPSSITLRLN
jgi:hypothetical protein